MSVTTLTEVVQHVKTCMCSALIETAVEIEGQPGCPCRTGAVPSANPTICCPDKGCDDNGDVGQMTVHVARVYRSSTFPVPDTGNLSCKEGPKTLVAEIVVRLVRCVPIPDKDGKLPTMDRQEAAAEIQFIDMMTLEQAVACCIPTMAGRRNPLKVAVLSHSSIGPTGLNGPNGLGANCAGSELHLAVDVGAVCCSEEPS